MLYEETYPNILFAKDGEIYTLGSKRYFVIGGAYSVDKFFRLQHGYNWWPDEQPSAETKALVERKIETEHIDIILSHTCPFKYIPTEAFIPGLDQSTVDQRPNIGWTRSRAKRIIKNGIAVIGTSKSGWIIWNFCITVSPHRSDGVLF